VLKVNEMHQAVDVFRNHLLDGFDDENRKLRQTTKLLKAAVVDIFTKVELRLRDGSVYITEFKEDSLSHIPIDPTIPRPLVNFKSAEVRLMGQTVDTLPMALFFLSVQQGADGKIYLIFQLSPQCTVKGYLDGLSDEDFADFTDTAHAERQISTYLQTGTGLQNAAAVTFTPTSFALKMFSTFHQTLTTFGQRPSRESVHNDLMSKLAVRKSSLHAGLVSQDEDVLQSKYQSEDLILSTFAAFGHTNDMLNLLVENRLAKNEYFFLSQIQEMIGTVEISHPGFNTKAFLKDGWLDNNKEGVLVWRIDVTTNAIPLSITIDNIYRLKVSVSGIRMLLGTGIDIAVAPSWNGIDIDGFSMRWENGIRVDGSVYSTDSDSFLNSVGDVDITVDLPLSVIQNTLVALGLRD
jgi:hypothetical protein